jgi:CrcB protein
VNDNVEQRPKEREPVDPDVDLADPEQRGELRAPHGGAVLAAIALGGILGAEARYGLGLAWPHPVSGWPWSTFVINFSGCLLIGVLMILITERFTPHPLLRPLLGVGVLGGYTTFSTFTVDIVTLAVHGHPFLGVAYLVATPIAALAAVWIGAALTRRIVAERTERDQTDQEQTAPGRTAGERP